MIAGKRPVRASGKVLYLSVFSYSESAPKSFRREFRTITADEQMNFGVGHEKILISFEQQDEVRFNRFIHQQTEGYVCFKHLSLNTLLAQKWTKRAFLSLLRRFFESECDSFFFVYVGHADGEPRLFINEDCVISYEDVYSAWREAGKNRQLLLYLDFNFAGRWVEECKGRFHFDRVAIQASTDASQYSYCMESLGSLFLVDFTETIIHRQQRRQPTQANTRVIIRQYVHFSYIGLYFDVLATYGLHFLFGKCREIVAEVPQFQECEGYLGVLTNNFKEVLGVFGNQSEEYEGQFRKNKKHGWGRIRYKQPPHQGDRYVGTFRAEKRHGIGIMFYANGDVYEGEWVEDQKQGKGELKFRNGGRFKGGFVGNRRQGWGREDFASGEWLECAWFQNDIDGEVKYKYSNGDFYEGLFGGRRRNGKGRLTKADGQVDEGTFREDRLEGQGRRKYASGDQYVGAFRGGLRHGVGQMTYSNGNTQCCDWVDDVKNVSRRGRSLIHFEDGVYEGESIGQTREGQGVMRYFNGSVYRGAWKGDQRHGQGTLYKLGGFIIEGNFKEDKYITPQESCVIS